MGSSISMDMCSRRKRKVITQFEDLPDELLLMMCRYLTSVHVIQAFHDYNDRLYHCIDSYRKIINLTRCSYDGFQYFLKQFQSKRLLPSTLIVSNALVSSQIDNFIKIYDQQKSSFGLYVNHLSLLDCSQRQIHWLAISTDYYFVNLRSFRLVECASSQTVFTWNYSTIENLRRLIFDNHFRALIELELTINKGIILDKRLSPNRHLKRLTISLKAIDDLVVLLDGLIPNLCTLNVTICHSRCYTVSPFPSFWPRVTMPYMNKFRLTTNDNVDLNLDVLRGIVAPLTQLDQFRLDVHGPISHDCVTQGDRIEMFIDELLPQMRYFHFSVKTTCNVDKQTFVTLNQRWPITCKVALDDQSTHVYTIPWSFEDCRTSMLANDDITSVCPSVTALVIDSLLENVAQRFPNVETLTIRKTDKLCLDNFRHLRHLKTDNIENIVPCLARRIHTLTLIDTDASRLVPFVYFYVRHLTLDSFHTDLMQCFPNLQSLTIQSNQVTPPDQTVDMILNSEELPHISVLKITWPEIANTFYANSGISIWIADGTRLKFRSAPFYAHFDQMYFTVWL